MVWAHVRAAAAVDDHRRAHQRAAQLLHQRPVHLAAGRLSGDRPGRRRCHRVGHPRVLGDDRRSSRSWPAGASSCSPARHLSDAAVHHAMADLAERRLIDDWLGDFAYYRAQFFRRPIDNPDQRIQQDIDIFTTGVGGDRTTRSTARATLCCSARSRQCCRCSSFGAILWQLSGPLSIGGVDPAQGAVLDRASPTCWSATIVAFVDRQTADPPELSQRVAQCGLPVCAGAGARRRRRDRSLPGRARRTHGTRGRLDRSWTTTATG